MRWKPRRRSIRKRNTVGLAIDAYVSWREECRAVRNAYLASEWRLACIAVRTAYQEWANAAKADGSVAHAAYQAALDREDAAAGAYARL